MILSVKLTTAIQNTYSTLISLWAAPVNESNFTEYVID